MTRMHWNRRMMESSLWPAPKHLSNPRRDIWILLATRVEFDEIAMRVEFDESGVWREWRSTRVDVDESGGWREWRLTRVEVDEIGCWREWTLTRVDFDESGRWREWTLTRVEVDESGGWRVTRVAQMGTVIIGVVGCSPFRNQQGCGWATKQTYLLPVGLRGEQ